VSTLCPNRLTRTASVPGCCDEKGAKLQVSRVGNISAVLSIGSALSSCVIRYAFRGPRPCSDRRRISRHSSTGHREHTVIPKQGIKLEMDEVAENCVLLGYCAASCGNLLPTIPDSLSVPSSGTKRGPIGCLETSARNYPYSA